MVVVVRRHIVDGDAPRTSAPPSKTPSSRPSRAASSLIVSMSPAFCRSLAPPHWSHATAPQSREPGGRGRPGLEGGCGAGHFLVDGANFVCVIQPASGVAAEKGPPRPCLQASSAVGEFRWLRRARVSSLERFFKHAGSFWLRCVLRKMSVGHVCVCPRVWRGWHSGCARELKGLLPPHFPPNNSHAAWTTGTWCLVG